MTNTQPNTGNQKEKRTHHDIPIGKLFGRNNIGSCSEIGMVCVSKEFTSGLIEAKQNTHEIKISGNN